MPPLPPIQNISITPKQPLPILPLSPSPRQPLTRFPGFIDLTPVDVSYKSNHTTYDCLCLASLLSIFIQRLIHAVAYSSNLFLLPSCVSLYEYTAQHVYPWITSLGYFPFPFFVLTMYLQDFPHYLKVLDINP